MPLPALSRPIASVVLTAGLVLLGACVATTTFTSTWKDPAAQPVNPVGKTVVAVFVTRNEGQRRAAEDTMAGALNRHGAHGVPSYTLIPDGHMDAEGAQTRLKTAGANGAVVVRVVGQNQQVSYTPGAPAPAYYGRFSGYWGYGWGTVYDPGYLRTDTIVSVETLVYSFEQDKLLWAGTSRTTNPDKLDAFLNEVADAVANEMTKQGLLVK